MCTGVLEGLSGSGLDSVRSCSVVMIQASRAEEVLGSVLMVWSFVRPGLRTLGSSVSQPLAVQELESIVNDDMARESLSNKECILDVPFTLDEVSNVVRKLKRGKAGGYDGILAEHLICGGDVIITWLLTILNSIIELEAKVCSVRSLKVMARIHS